MANINFIVKNDIELKGNLIFEGATADAYETTLAITDPTADRTITFPNSTGTVALTSDIPTLDADLVAIGVLTGTSGILKKTAANTWSLITDNSTNWDTAYTDRNKWDGGATGLTPATGRTSLGATTVGANIFTLTNPSAISFPKINADNTVVAESAANYKASLSLNNVENTALSTWAGSTNITTLGTIATGVWSGTAIATSKGGTGLTSIGTAGQVLRVNAGATALEWGIGTSYIGTTQTQASSATQALTGISSITGATTLALDSTTTSALNIGTGANAKAITVGNNTATTAVNVNTGNILNSATLGGGLDINDTINIHNATTTISSTAATSIFTDTAAYSTIEYTIQAKVGSNYRSSKIMLVCNGTTTTSFTEYAILENAANSIPITFTASATSGVVTLNGAFTGWTTGNNITVKVIRTGIV